MRDMVSKLRDKLVKVKEDRKVQNLSTRCLSSPDVFYSLSLSLSLCTNPSVQ